jgi:hypothetical protein
MRSDYQNKAMDVPERKLLTADEEAKLVRQATIDMEAAQRARDDADPWIVAGRLTPAEQAFIAESEARLETLKAEVHGANQDLAAAIEAEAAARYMRSRFDDPDPDHAAGIADAVRVVTAARKAHAAAYQRLSEATSEEAEAQASIGPFVRARQAAVRRELDAEGQRQYQAEQAAMAQAVEAAAKDRAERVARMKADAEQAAEAKRRRLFGLAR